MFTQPQTQTLSYNSEHSYAIIFKILSDIYDGGRHNITNSSYIFIKKKPIHYIMTIT